MFSARDFVGWYNGLPEKREVSWGSTPTASSSSPLSQGWKKEEPPSRTGRLPVRGDVRHQADRGGRSPVKGL